MMISRNFAHCSSQSSPLISFKLKKDDRIFPLMRHHLRHRRDGEILEEIGAILRRFFKKVAEHG